VDLNGPAYNPTNCPDWAKERLPDWVLPYVGLNGTPEAWRPKGKPFGAYVESIDRYQANWFIYYGPQTADYLYGAYTPLKVDYKPGTLPGYEAILAKYTAGCTSDTQKAVTLLKAMPEFFRHPSMPPLGPSVKANRGLDDEELLATGCGFCNEQARVFIRLCQIAGIQARMLHLFNQAHTVAEFYADGRWALADASNFFVVPDKQGRLLSAAQCHDRGEGQRLYAEVKERRLQELAKLSDEELARGDAARAAKYRAQYEKPLADELAVRDIGFGVVNYPLPTQTDRPVAEHDGRHP
jgi:transglutaminase-like putative cysteine protease